MTGLEKKIFFSWFIKNLSANFRFLKQTKLIIVVRGSSDMNSKSFWPVWKKEIFLSWFIMLKMQMKQFWPKSAQMGDESKRAGKLRYWLFRCLASQYNLINWGIYQYFTNFEHRRQFNVRIWNISPFGYYFVQFIR